MHRRRGLAVAIAALGWLLVPRMALAQSFSVQEDAKPGITITGVGFARVTAPSRLSDRSIQQAIDAAHPTAVSRAVRDARRRGAAIAKAAGVRLGQVSEVELDDASFQFQPPGGRVPPFTAAAATVTFSIPDGAQGSDSARQVQAYGTAAAPVEPRDPRGNQSIRYAVLAARRAVTPKAAVAAIGNAETASRSAGLTLGGLVSISEPRDPYFYDAALGSFGAGRYCAVVRRAIVRPDPDTGRPRVVRRVRRRRCSYPRPFSLRLEATYEAR